MIHIAIVAVLAIIVVYIFGPIIASVTALTVVAGGRGYTSSHMSNALVTYTLGEFKTLGGFTTLGESVCRAVIYLQTKKLLMPHTGATVPWLQYRGVHLELDGLDEEHRLAFEYDGPQHYSWPEWCKMGRRAQKSEHVLDYYRARFYDRIKSQLCAERGIRLVRVSTWTTFDAMRQVVAHALEHDYSEHRPVDDSHVINEFVEIDTRDSTLYPQLEWGTDTLALPGAEWRPHPYRQDGIYQHLFREELRGFVDCVREGLLSCLPVGEPQHRDEIYRGVMAHFDQQLTGLDQTEQLADVRAALDDAVRSIAVQLCL